LYQVINARSGKEKNIMYAVFSGKYLKEILKAFLIKGSHKMET
jgi:hypothetical protein